MEIKTSNGCKLTFTNIYEFAKSTRITMSAQAVDQALEQAQASLQAGRGRYSWTLEGDCYNGYKIIARDGWGQYWTDGSGKTPRAALCDFLGVMRKAK
jgi:hypothetical protein